MLLNELKPAPGAKKAKTRVGRGVGSGDGKTCGRGHKGQKSRSGGYHKVGFEGGQMPLQRRLPKSGFSSRLAKVTQEIRLDALNQLEGEVTFKTLQEKGFVSHSIRRAKVYLAGDLTQKISLKGISATKGAKAAIEKLGGQVEA